MELKVTNESIELNDGIKAYPCRYDEVIPQEVPMIVSAKKSLLQEIDLEDVLTNLDNSSELLYIAFCALNGKSMQADLDGLQFSLLKLCGQSKTTMTTFRDQSKEITTQILASYKFMKKGMVDPAKIIFESTANYAKSMAKQSQDLSNQFDGLANQTGVVLKKVEVEHGNEVSNKQMIEAELNVMQAEKNKQESLSKSLAEDLISINREYQEEKASLKSAEKKEMTLAITSMITGALSLGISAAVSSKSGGQSTANTEEINSLTTKQQEKTQQQTKINADKQQAETKLQTLNTEMVDLKNSVRTKSEQAKNKKEICNQETDQTVKESLQKEVATLETEVKEVENKVTEKQKEIDKVEQSLKDYTAELQGVSAALKSITGSLEKMQQQAQNAVDSHSKKVSALLEKKLAMEKEKRESLAEMEKFALLIQGNNNKVITTDTAIQMLIVAIRCLKKVAASLITAAMFWQSLQKYCEKLSSTTITKLLDAVKDYSKEDRIEFFTDQDFVLSIITYASQWAAMYYVSDEYYQAANKTFKHTETNFQSTPDTKEAMQIAQNRSTTILAGITKQQHASTIASTELEKQMKALQVSK